MIFNKVLCFMIALSFTSAHAEEAATPAPSISANSEEGLRKSFQREYVYLVSQKEALSKQKNQMQQSFQKRISEAKGQTQALQKELVRLTAQNDDSHEELMSLEKRKKELQKRGSSLENTYKKALKSTNEFEAGLRFQSAGNKKDEVPPENLQFADFDAMFEKNMATLEASTQVETFPGAFLDQKDKLVEGTVTRIGRNAAIGTVGDAHFVLGPNGEGLLKALEKSRPPESPSLNVYIFDSLNKVAKLQKQGGFMEKLADLSPLLFLSLMLMLVVGLFSSLLRV
jgi:Skp family chaperone for outer membrane proteins